MASLSNIIQLLKIDEEYFERMIGTWGGGGGGGGGGQRRPETFDNIMFLI